MGLPLFLVGGAVRDLVLGRAHIDVDLCTEGDVAPLARALAREAGGRAVLHLRFGTATVRGPEFHVDLARTRSETYARPGALPSVRPAGLGEDLARRDFSFNAMALRLTPPAGEVIDPFGGRADLEAGLVRVLHTRSFQDDATRMVRAVRYASRLGFRMDARTEELLRRDLTFLSTVSGPRLRRELALVLREAEAVAAVLLAERLGVLAAIDGRLAAPEGLVREWQEALSGPRLGDPELLGWCLISRCEDESDVDGLSLRLHLAGRAEASLRDAVRLRGLSDKLVQPQLGAGVKAEVLDGLRPEAVWARSLRSDALGVVCRHYVENWRRARPALKGHDLIALGIAPGPALGEALRSLRRARIEGKVGSREEELALVKREFGGGG